MLHPNLIIHSTLRFSEPSPYFATDSFKWVFVGVVVTLLRVLAVVAEALLLVSGDLSEVKA